jgi:pimeloyl-ACP methyl ester carboxylesterase
MSKTTTTIVLVHGFWGGAAHWSKVILALARKGYHDLRAVELPLTSLTDDAERTRKMVAQVSGPVVLVGHSYGGAVISQAGDLPNVTALVYIAAFAPDAGESPGGHHPAASAGRRAQPRARQRRLPVDQAGQVPRELLPGPHGG